MSTATATSLRRIGARHITLPPPLSNPEPPPHPLSLLPRGRARGARGRPARAAPGPDPHRRHPSLPSPPPPRFCRTGASPPTSTSTPGRSSPPPPRSSPDPASLAPSSRHGQIRPRGAEPRRIRCSFASLPRRRSSNCLTGAPSRRRRTGSGEPRSASPLTPPEPAASFARPSFPGPAQRRVRPSQRPRLGLPPPPTWAEAHWVRPPQRLCFFPSYCWASS